MRLLPLAALRRDREQSIYAKFHSTHYQHTDNLIPCILSIAKFFLKSNTNSASVWLNFIPHILSIYQISNCIFLLYIKFHSPYYQYMDNFITCIISICKVLPEIKHSFRVLPVSTIFHSAYYQCTVKFIQRIIRIH
jgi:hypothetical protein